MPPKSSLFNSLLFLELFHTPSFALPNKRQQKRSSLSLSAPVLSLLKYKNRVATPPPFLKKKKKKGKKRKERKFHFKQILGKANKIFPLCFKKVRKIHFQGFSGEGYIFLTESLDIDIN